MYKRLLLSAGGGIKDEQNGLGHEEGACPTIAIGLGGSGVECIEKFKQMVYDTMKSETTPDGKEKYNTVKFFGIDMDDSALQHKNKVNGLDPTDEFLCLRNEDINIKDIYTSESDKTQWFEKKQDGNGMTRQIARLHFMSKSEIFVEKITRIIRDIGLNRNGGFNFKIHIVTSLAGHTGSGIVLDVCYLIQHIFYSLGMSGCVIVYGYFLMPDLYMCQTLDSGVKECLRNNGYASMSELDYCMHFDTNGGKWKQNYGNIQVETNIQPVHVAYLVSGNVGSYENRYYKGQIVNNILLNFYSDFSFDLNWMLSGLPRISLAKGPYYALNNISMQVPRREINTYLVSKIFEKFRKLDKQLPSDNDIDLFVHNVGLRYEDISRDLNNGVWAIPNYPVDTRTIYEQTKGLTADTIPQVLVQMRDATSKISGKLAENKKAMLQELEQIKVESGQTVVSMVARVNNKLKEIASQPDKGPYYAGAILHNSLCLCPRDLQNKIAGYIEKNAKDISKARADMSLREQIMANALRELQNSNALNRKGRGQNYVNSVNQYFKQSSKIEELNVLHDVLVTFGKQIVSLFEKKYKVLNNVIDELEYTFAANLSVLSQTVNNNNGWSWSTLKVVSVENLKALLDSEVATMKIDDMIRGFVTHMLDNPEIWIEQNENKIANAVSSHFQYVLLAVTGKIRVDWARLLIERVSDMRERRKIKLAKFRVWEVAYDSFGGNVVSAERSDEMRNVYEELKKYNYSHTAINYDYSGREQVLSFPTDLIFISDYIYGMQMSDYKGISLDEKMNFPAGTFIYEGTEDDSRDWRNIWSILPAEN